MTDSRATSTPGVREWAVVAVLGAAFTLGLQWWVGDATIYGAALAERRLALHDAILANVPPGGVSWTVVGGDGVNIRLVAVYLAELAHRVTGLAIPKAYFVLETGWLWSTFPLVFAYLRGWFAASWSMVGVLLYTGFLPLTYFLHYFHPWDRLSLAMWLVLLLLLRANRVALMAPVLALAVVVKFDIVLFPGLYWLARVERERWKAVTGWTAALFAVSFAVYYGLRLAVPGGFEDRDVGAQVALNVRVIRELHLFYPPLLMFGPMVALAALGIARSDRLMRAMVGFGLLLFVPLFLATNFVEVRAEMPSFVLLLAAAVAGLQRLMEETVS